MIWVLVVALGVALCVVAALLWRLRVTARESAALAAELSGERDTTAGHDHLEAVKSDFLATASHELRSPLTSIKGFIELLENGIRDGQITDREREFVQIIHRSTDRLVELVDELLDVARIDADHVELRRRPIDVGEAVSEVAEMMGARLADKDQRLGVYISPSLPPALADAGRVRQIIGNLLTNAHLYTPAGGRIHVGAEPDRAWVRIVVADSGVGMSEDESTRIFERFYRAPHGSATAPGTGLGLSIVRSLVALHGGEIEVASRPGQGTTFQIRLPAAREDVVEPGALAGRGVIVVAAPSTARAIVGELERAEVDARAVAGGSGGGSGSASSSAGSGVLEALRERPVDAIVLEGPAVELAARIRGDAELRAVPIVFATPDPGDPRLAGEWTTSVPLDGPQLRATLAGALRTGRSRVLIVARESLAFELEPALDDLGIEYEWVTGGAAATRRCGERRFELALLDSGLRNPEAVFQALALRGRRLRRAVIVLATGDAPPPASIADAGLRVVSRADAPAALLSALRGHSHPDDEVLDAPIGHR